MTALMRTIDGLVNLMSHLGGARDKQAYSRFEYTPMAGAELTSAYRGWLANKLTNIIPEDMIREGRTVYVDDADSSEFADFAEDLDALGVLASAYGWGRLYGGGAAYMVVGEEDPAKPLNVDSVSPSNPLLSLIDFNRHDVQVRLNENPRARSYMRPEYYQFHGETTWIHWSRVLGPFDGYRLPRAEQRMAQGWGGSEVEKVSEVALQSLAANASVASLMHRSNSLVLGVKGLLQKTAKASSTAELQRRFEVASLMMSNNSFTLYDLDSEQPANMTLDLTAPTALMAEFLSIVSAAADIPVTRFFGTAPKGLNATGEGDRKNYNMMIAGKQRRVFGPALRVLDKLIVRSVYGRDLGVTSDWNPLETPSELEIAQAGNIRSSTHRAYLDMGVIVPSMVARELQADDTYTAMDDQFVLGLTKLEGLDDGEPGEPDDAGDMDTDSYDKSEETPDGDQ